MSDSPEKSSLQRRLENLSAGSSNYESPAFQLELQATSLMVAAEMRFKVLEKDEAGEVIGGVVHSDTLDLKTESADADTPPTNFILIGNPFDNLTDIIKVPTLATAEEIRQIKAEILPFPEAYEMLVLIAHAYQSRQPLILEGPTSIGKTFLVDKFTEMIYGPGVKPYDFYCNAQTDTSELIAKYVPNKNKVEPKDPSFVLQYGALPKAMGLVEEEKGLILHPGIREEGNILHIQEVGLAEPAIINVLLQLRGQEGKIADSLQLWDDSGAVVKAGRGFWLVMSTNPPEAGGYLDRNPIDPALARGSIYARLNELSSESLKLAVSRYMGRSTPNQALCRIDEDPRLVELLSNVLGIFHETFRDWTNSGERGRGQRIPATLTDIFRVVEYLKHNQILSLEDGAIDLTQTLRKAIEMYYLQRLADSEAIKKLKDGLEDLLTGSLGRVTSDKGEDVTFAKAVEKLVLQNSMSLEEKCEMFKDTISQAHYAIREDLMKKYGDMAWLAETRLWQQLQTWLSEASEATENLDVKRVEQIAESFQKLQEIGFDFDPCHLRELKVLEIEATASPLVLEDGRFVVVASNCLKIINNEGVKETIEIGEKPILDYRIVNNTVYLVSGENVAYTYDLAKQELATLHYCGYSTEFEAIKILPLQNNAAENGVIIGTRQGVVFRQEQPGKRFKSFVAADPNMEVGLLENFVEENYFIIGERFHDEPNMFIVDNKGAQVGKFSIYSSSSLVVLPLSKTVFVGHSNKGGHISVYAEDELVSDGAPLELSQRSSHHSAGISQLLGVNKSVDFLAFNKEESFVAFASRLGGAVCFLANQENETLINYKIELPDNVTGLTFTATNDLIITTTNQIYIYENSLGDGRYF